MENYYALIVAILGCEVKEVDLEEDEVLGVRHYPKSAEDAFRCLNGLSFKYESHQPTYYDIENNYHYRNRSAKLAVV